MPVVLIKTEVGCNKLNEVHIEFVYHMESKEDMNWFLHQLNQSDGGTIQFKGELSGQITLRGVKEEQMDFWGPDGMGEDGAYRW